MVTSVRAPRPLRRSPGAGGSKPGKPQGKWPWVMKIVAEAVVVRSVGSLEAAMNGDRGFAQEGVSQLEGFKRVMDATLPGWHEWCMKNMVQTKETKQRLLENRVYKSLEYVGSSAGSSTPVRGMSRENWRFHFTGDHSFHRLYDSVRHGVTVSVDGWESLLGMEPNV